MLLAIDTSGSIGTVALARREDRNIALLAQAELEGKTYSAMLITCIRELLEREGVALRQVEAIVVAHGPGSFTGVRVGLGAVKGIAEAMQMPVVAVSRLKVLAAKAALPFAALDAGRGEFYLGRYDLEAIEKLASGDEVREAVAPGQLAMCEEKVALAFPGAQRDEPPTAWDAMNVALPRILAADFDDVASLDGNYVRRSDAELFAWKKAPMAARNT